MYIHTYVCVIVCILGILENTDQRNYFILYSLHIYNKNTLFFNYIIILINQICINIIK